MSVEVPDLKDVESRIAELMAETELGTMATVTPEGKPHASCLHMISLGTTMYFSSWQYARKYAHIKENPNVAVEIRRELPNGFEDRMKARALQISGKASYVTDLDEMQAIIDAGYEQHPFLKDFDMMASFKKVLTGNTPLEKIRQRIIRVDPVEALYADNTVHFMWRHMIDFDEEGHVSNMYPYPGDQPAGLPDMDEDDED